MRKEVIAANASARRAVEFTLARLAPICQTSPLQTGHPALHRSSNAAHSAVIGRLIHFTRRATLLAAIALPLFATGGCAMFDKETWDFSKYRDERAADIDRRLDKPDATVKSPF